MIVTTNHSGEKWELKGKKDIHDTPSLTVVKITVSKSIKIKRKRERKRGRGREVKCLPRGRQGGGWKETWDIGVEKCALMKGRAYCRTDNHEQVCN